MTPPTLPPEARDAVQRAGLCQRHTGRHIHEIVNENVCPACVDGWLRAAYPHLRRAILEAELPRIVAMAREGVEVYDPRTTEASISWHHTPASILAALNTNPGATE